MNALHNLVVQGKVLYLARCITALSVNDPDPHGAKGNLGHTGMDRAQGKPICKDHGKTPFSIYQGKWSVLERSFERDIIPMARAEGLALAPWDVIGGGKIRSDAEEQRRRETGEKGRMIFGPDWERTEEEKKVCLVLEEVAKEVGVGSITSGALSPHNA